ncbi:MAG TPA: carboxylate--amine ligase [Bdellovibrionota bacterium]|jgi:predicted ATP-grasp superfamily ATP-dependent carboligase|nr:carboxylate--amine ligase [Bdellovibrionota bacterium]
MEQSAPAVILGGSLNALGVVRSLAPGKMPIHVLETTWNCPCAWSRLCHFGRVESLEGRPLVDGLLRLSARLGQRAVLICTDDRAVETVSTYRAELESLYRFSLPTAEMVRTLADKAEFHRYAERQGLPVPRSVIVTSAGELSAVEALKMPVALKPIEKARALNGQVTGAARAETPAQASALADRMISSGGPVIVQEWIDGPDTDIYFTLFTCNSDGDVVGMFTGRKLVCDPPHMGCTALCVAAGEPTFELEKWTRRLIQLTGYRGLGGLEFKRDRLTGRFLIVEPTVGRTDWQEEIATLCGVNLPHLTYLTELGIKPGRVPSPAEVTVPAAWRSARRHQAPQGLLPAGAKMGGGYFRVGDPMPALFYYGYQRLLARALNLLKRLRLRQGRSAVHPLVRETTA